MDNLKYDFCEDWFIYSKDVNGNQYFVSTELWCEWLDLQDGADQEENAIEKYMLPVAMTKWEKLCWRPVDEPDDFDFNFLDIGLPSFLGGPEGGENENQNRKL